MRPPSTFTGKKAVTQHVVSKHCSPHTCMGCRRASAFTRRSCDASQTSAQPSAYLLGIAPSDVRVDPVVCDSRQGLLAERSRSDREAHRARLNSRSLRPTLASLAALPKKMGSVNLVDESSSTNGRVRCDCANLPDAIEERVGCRRDATAVHRTPSHALHRPPYARGSTGQR